MTLIKVGGRGTQKVGQMRRIHGMAIDPVMLMDQLRKETGGTVYGKDIKSAFNSVGGGNVAEIFKDLPDLALWIDRFLEPRNFNIVIDQGNIGSTTMTGGAPQGPPLSPALFSIYMSHMITEAQQEMDTRDARRTRKH